MDDFMKFPTGQKAQAVMEAFEEKKGFPGVMGTIDGTHTPIKTVYKSKRFLFCPTSFVTRIYL